MSHTTQLKLRKFDMRWIKDDSVVVLLGKRNTGKSYIMRELLSKHTSIPLGVVISPTESANSFFGDFMPKMFIYDDFNSKIVENVVKRQKAAINAVNREKSAFGGECNIDPRGFLVLDDCLFDTKWTRDINMRYLFLNGRHIRCMLVLTMQYVLGMPPTMRSNIDFTFILRENGFQNRRKIFENYASMFNSFELFSTVMDQCTNNYECLVINNTTKSNRLEDQVFWYKAPPSTEPFKLCNSQYWTLDRQCRKEDTGAEGEVFDLDKFRKATKLNVKVVKA